MDRYHVSKQEKDEQANFNKKRVKKDLKRKSMSNLISQAVTANDVI